MNELEIRRFLDVIHPDNDLFEIRVIDGKKNYSGYFSDSELAYEHIKQFSSGNIYVVLNQIKPACYSRQQRDTMVMNPKSTTSDNDISSRKWVLIDIDPKRPSDCNSSDSELQASKEVMSKLYVYLKGIGFCDPVFGMSGNGYHMLYRTELENNAYSTELIKKFLAMLNIMFETDLVGIDNTVFNASRITKVIGTVSRKGTDKDMERPQRLSQLLYIPDKINTNAPALFERVANMMPEKEKPTYHNNYGRDSFDIDKFISDHNINVAKDYTAGHVRKIILQECPFDTNHKSPDSAIFVLNNGAIGFKCLHNSCSHMTWRDVRAFYDPSAYREHKDTTRSIQPSVRLNKKPDMPVVEPNTSKFLQLHEVKNIDRSMMVSIPTGFKGLDDVIIGLNKGEVSLVSGSNASGKSTWINQICLNAINSGFKATIFSGELTASRMKSWIHLQCAGRQYTTQSKFSANSFYVKPSIGEKIDAWTKEKLFIYNNDYGNKFDRLIKDLDSHIDETGTDLIILDNLMALDILMLEGDNNSKQSILIKKISTFAKEKNIHLIIIAHPRKTTTFLRKTDISGTADLTNIVDNVFIIHRVNNDFVKHSGEFYGTAKAAEYFTFHNVVEVCKNRDLGVQDELIGLYFEIESKRFLNDRYENIMFGWTDRLEEQYQLDDSMYSVLSPLSFKPNTAFDKDPFGESKKQDLDSEYPF